jgi:hypothetical protein
LLLILLLLPPLWWCLCDRELILVLLPMHAATSRPTIAVGIDIAYPLSSRAVLDSSATFSLLEHY